MNTLKNQHLGTYMAFVDHPDGPGRFLMFNAASREDARTMAQAATDFPVLRIETVEENVRAACDSQETYDRWAAK